jgi:hypothetical protein
MKKKRISKSRGEAWCAAEEALAAARLMPRGTSRAAALKEAGQLRFLADEQGAHRGLSMRAYGPGLRDALNIRLARRRRAKRARIDFVNAQTERKASDEAR